MRSGIGNKEHRKDGKLRMKKYICAALSVMFVLSLAGCGSSGDSAPAPADAATAGYAAASEDAMEEAEREFSNAVENYLEEEAVLLGYIQEAEEYLETVTKEYMALPEEERIIAEITGEIDINADSLEEFRSLVDSARAAVAEPVPEMQSDAETVRQQTQDIIDRKNQIWDLSMDMEGHIEAVREFQQFWAEMNKTEIIMVKAELNTRYNYTVYGVDPETGEQRVISEFSIPTSVTANADGSKWQTYPMFIPSYSARMPLRGMFSRDYQYLAVTRYSLETGEYRAGYYKEGEGLYYTDISKCVDAVGGDFDEPVKQMAIGFTKNGRFIFADMPSVPGWYYDTSDWVFSQVEMSDYSTDVIRNSLKTYDTADDFLMRGDGWNWMEKNWELTDWIDDTRCLINYPEKSVGLMMGGDRIDRWGIRIYDTETGEMESFIPGESRSNWSGVISPDRKSVAFLSAPASGTGSASLYTVPITGGEPMKICGDIPSGRGSTGYTITRPTSGSTVYFLLEWR